jgi:hypothetical protein
MGRPLGNASATGAPDPNNLIAAGNFTVTFDPKTIGITAGQFECYHIVINGPPGSTFQIYIGTKFWDNVYRGDINSWDPHQTMKLFYGDTVYFYWSTGAGTPPTVTMFFQEASLV